jgi:hypothetical protein
VKKINRRESEKNTTNKKLQVLEYTSSDEETAKSGQARTCSKQITCKLIPISYTVGETSHPWGSDLVLKLPTMCNKADVKYNKSNKKSKVYMRKIKTE